MQEVSTKGAVGGSFTLTYRGETTRDITWDATADEFQSALEVNVSLIPYILEDTYAYSGLSHGSSRSRIYVRGCGYGGTHGGHTNTPVFTRKAAT